MTGTREGYLQNLVDVAVYNEIVDSPLNKQAFIDKPGNVYKLIREKKGENVTWVSVYRIYMDNNTYQAKKVYLLLPERLGNVSDENKYVLYASNSKTWNAYRENIDNRNAELQKKYAKLLRESIGNMEIKYTENNIEKESIKEDYKVLDKEGYFGEYVSGEKGIYYIQKSNYKIFTNAFKKLNSNFVKEKLEYYN